jgi:hypothetical protein
MPLVYRLSAMMAVAVVSCCFVFAQQDARNPDAAWHTDYAKALEEARKTGKPLFVTFACLH